MPKKIEVGCKLPDQDKVSPKIEETNNSVRKETSNNMIKVGKKAPVFSAPAYYKGEFVNVNLEDYKGKWVLLCFYPGDFTFV